jgi:hypothetical protein
MISTMYATMDDMRKELDKLRKIKYTARLNFKQVTFTPILEDRDRG